MVCLLVAALKGTRKRDICDSSSAFYLSDDIYVDGLNWIDCLNEIC